MKPTEAEISALKAKHPEDLHQLTALGKVVVVRSPTPEEYQRYVDYGTDEDRRPIALATLLRSVVVWPAEAEFNAMIERWPGLNQSFGGEVARLAGLTRVVEVKKL